MAQSYTYDDGAMREDLLDVLTNLSVTDTQLVSGLPTGSATQIQHNWLIDTLTAAKVNAQIEGADATFHALSNPTRLTNYTQIFKQGFMVSDSERAVNTAAFNDRYTYEQAKALKMLKHDMEFALVRGTLVTGTGTAARSLRGIKASLSLVTSQSGVTMSEAILNDLLQLVWDNSSAPVTALYGDMYLKRKVSGFTAGSTKQTQVTDRRLINSVDIYESDAAGVTKLFAHKYVTTAADIAGNLNHDVLGINEDYFRIDYLRKPFSREIPKTGDSTKGEVLAEMTLANLHYNAGFLSKAML